MLSVPICVMFRILKVIPDQVLDPRKPGKKLLLLYLRSAASQWPVNVIKNHSEEKLYFDRTSYRVNLITKKNFEKKVISSKRVTLFYHQAEVFVSQEESSCIWHRPCSAAQEYWQTPQSVYKLYFLFLCIFSKTKPHNDLLTSLFIRNRHVQQI